jgi:acetyl-CoA acetyltransferase
MDSRLAEKRGLSPLGIFRGFAAAGCEPDEMGIGPVFAVPRLLERAGVKMADVGLFELNEAFAAQVLCNIKAVGIDEKKLNICGGGIALGHPIGASGARVLTTLIHQLKRTGGKRGVAALCLGGGNSVAMVVEV